MCFGLVLICLVPPFQESRSYFDTPQIVLDAVFVPNWGDAGRFTTVGDFDGDGHLDLIGEWGYSWGTNSYQELKIWFGAGDGTIARRWQKEIFSQFVGYLPLVTDGFVAVGELGAPDARDDFVHGYNESIGGVVTGVLRLYLGRATPLLYQEHRIGQRILDVEMGDWDGNGNGDVAALVVEPSGRRMVLYLLGPGNERRLGLPAGEWSQLERGDFSGDGVTDLAVVSPTAVVVRSLEHGQKVLRAPGADVFEHGLPGPDSAAGDLDGDGDDDVVMFTHPDTYRILWQEAPGRLALGPLQSGGPATELADIDGDGDLDGVCCGGGGGPGDATYDARAASMFEVSLSDGHGGFAPSFSLPSLASEHIAGAVDFDEDGDVDLIAGRTIYFNPGTIVPPIHFPTADPLIRPSSVGDVDGDGDPDFGLGLALCRLNDGSGHALDASPAMPAPPSGVVFTGPGFPGDLDGDGCTDLLVEATQGATFQGLHLLRNLGGGGFADAGLVAAPAQPYSLTTTLDARACRVTDLDGDGDADLLVHGNTAVQAWALQFVELWFNQGAGVLSPGPSWTSESLVDVADFDGDGVVDIAVLSGTGTGTGKLYWRRGLGGGAFNGRALIEDGPYGFNFDLADQPSAFRDLPSGLDSIAAVRPGSGAYSYLRSGTSWLELDLPALLRPEYYGTDDLVIQSWYRTSDVDSDGDGDLLSWPIVGTGTGLVLSGPSGLDTSGPRLLMEPRAFADVDGDGDADALTSEGVVLNRSFEGALNGARVQFGQGGAGAGGLVPTLGAVGPFREGQTVELRIRGGLGGAQATLALCRTRAEIADWPVEGLTSYVDPADPTFQTTPLTLDGPAGVAGTGTATVTFTVAPGLAGVHEYYQVWIADPSAPHGIAASNGLELDFGTL